jgi:hypothetical protein
VRSPAKRRLVAAIALIAQVIAGAAVHVAPANANEREPLPAKHLQTIRDAQVVRGAQKAPCPEHKVAQPESPVKADLLKADTAKSDPAKSDPAKPDPAKPDCCKDGSCKCPTATPAAVESRASAAPAACPAPRADGICEAPPSRLRPSVFFRPPI